VDKARAADLVAAFDALFGGHAGVRASHAKGLCCDATFTATSEAAAITTAPHMQGSPVHATVRFSHASGDPEAPDVERDSRGMAVKVDPEGVNETDIVALNQPVFIARTPEDFLEILRMRAPQPETGQPDLDGLVAYVISHPESQLAAEIFINADPVASFLMTEFFAIHAFRFIGRDGTRRFGRYHWVPSLGTASLPYEEAKELGRDYQLEDLKDRLQKGPATFDLYIQLAEHEDDPDDPTREWPQDRKKILAGKLDITGLVTDQQEGCERLLFDPMRLSEGIEPSNDPILLMRPHAYAVSGKRRSAR
jgi:catalase